MLNDISQSQRDKYCMIPLVRRNQNSQTHTSRKYNNDWNWEWEKGGIAVQWVKSFCYAR